MRTAVLSLIWSVACFGGFMKSSKTTAATLLTDDENVPNVDESKHDKYRPNAPGRKFSEKKYYKW